MVNWRERLKWENELILFKAMSTCMVCGRVLLSCDSNRCKAISILYIHVVYTFSGYIKRRRSTIKCRQIRQPQHYERGHEVTLLKLTVGYRCTLTCMSESFFHVFLLSKFTTVILVLFVISKCWMLLKEKKTCTEKYRQPNTCSRCERHALQCCAPPPFPL